MVKVTPEAHEEIMRLLGEEGAQKDDATLRVVLCAG